MGRKMGRKMGYIVNKAKENRVIIKNEFIHIYKIAN
jgi:hypothetical protein